VDLARQLADSLRRMRDDAGLTHAQMAKRLGISRPTYTRLENGAQNTTLKTLTRVCRAARCDIGELFNGTISLGARRGVSKKTEEGG
jgi:DNA-binding XRE family transcriptional regulator